MTAPRLKRPKLDLKSGRVDLAHGGGGRAMAQLIEEIFFAAFDNPALRAADDFGAFNITGGRLVTATDAHVVSPLFFPGGDIGCLSVHGTINDVAMAGAAPLALTAAFVIEEGFPLGDLKRIADSMGAAAREAGVPIVTGDTKVVERGKGDGVFIATTGIGLAPSGLALSGANARAGDVVILSGPIGDHGVAVMSKRDGLSFDVEIRSDTAALHGLVAAMLATGVLIRVLRDPTRGGLSATVNEIAHQSGVGVRLDERVIPVRPEVQGACELLGLDPLHVANEGKLVAVAARDGAEALLAAMRAHPLAAGAAVIGEIVDDPHHFVTMRTIMGGTRVVDWLSGEQLPRIC